MKNSKAKRLPLLILTAALVGTTALGVGAACFVGDVNGDGKITAFDAQLLMEEANGLRQLTDEQRAAAGDSSAASLLAYIQGEQADLGDLDGDGAYEIYSAAGLYYIAENPALSYELTADIDLGGAVWTPVAGFSGSLNGNGYTVSSFTVDSSVGGNMGFFADTLQGSAVVDLNLRNVTVNAADDAGFIGILAGSNCGTVTGCTVTGTVTDTRESLNGGNICIGALAGRTETSIEGGTGITVTDDTGTYSVSGLCADVRLLTADSETVLTGLVGQASAGCTVEGQWRDGSNDSSLLSETMQARQDTVVQYMNAMGTVAWQVARETKYVASSGTSVHNQTFTVGTTYYGLPYNGHNGGLERFLSVMDDATGINVLDPTLADGDKATNTGFIQYAGNDCSSAVGWAWMQVSPVRVNSNLKDDGTESSPKEYAGGAYVRTTEYMVPNAANQFDKGIYPVGDWTTACQQGSDGQYYYDDVVGEFAYAVTDADNTYAFYELNGREVIAEAYAVTRKADALLFRNGSEDGDSSNDNGHVRLAAADPVVIRNADGSIDTAKSFFVTTEQGDGLYDRETSNSSWRINYKYTFDELMDETYDATPNSSGGVYLPITIRALRADYVKYAYVNEFSDAPVTGPASGKTYTNYRTVKSVVTVENADGQVLFTHEAYTGVGTENYREKGTTVDLAQAHGEAFAAATGMTDGDTYYYTVQLLLSNGQVLTVKDSEPFTYAVSQ